MFWEWEKLLRKTFSIVKPILLSDNNLYPVISGAKLSLELEHECIKNNSNWTS